MERLRLISYIFFDWESYDCPRKYEHFLGRIKSFKDEPALIGKDVLIPVLESRIYCKKTEPVNSADPKGRAAD